MIGEIATLQMPHEPYRPRVRTDPGVVRWDPCEEDPCLSFRANVVKSGET